MRTGTKMLLGVLTIGGMSYAVYRVATAEGKGAPISVDFAGATSFYLGTSHTPKLSITNNQGMDLPLVVALRIGEASPEQKTLTLAGNETRSLTFSAFSTSLDPGDFGDYDVVCSVSNTETGDVYLKGEKIATVTVTGIRSADWTPSIYDLDGNGIISEDEAKAAASDRDAGFITEEQATDVVEAYYKGLEKPVSVELSWA